MLKPAQLYAVQLNEEMIETWYKEEYMYYYGGVAEYTLELPDNNCSEHCFVSVDEYDNILGYISYNVDWISMSAEEWGIISFDIGNVTFAKDVYKAVCDCFVKYHFNRISFWCYADNPAIRGYRNFIKKCGGIECAHFRQHRRLRDGKLHDSVCFEILAGEFNAWRTY